MKAAREYVDLHLRCDRFLRILEATSSGSFRPREVPMNAYATLSAWLRRSGWPLLIALLQFALHLWVNARDSLFRDELYYLAAAQHPDLGYVDFPPFVALAAGFSRALFGASPLAIRLLPALAGALIVLITAELAAELGAGLAARALAAMAVALGPIFLAASGLLTMDVFDQLWWALAALVLLRLIQRDQARLWLVFGLVAGLGLLTKVTMAFYGFALLAGLLLSGQRKLLFNRWLVYGGLIALVIFSPYVLWQVLHGFPTLDFWKSYATNKTYPVTPLEFLGQQVQTINPLVLPLALAGLYFLFFAPAGKPYRVFGWAYVILYVLFTLQQAKVYFLSPAYPVLFAGGAYAMEQFVQARPRWGWLPPACFRTILVSGLLLAPFSIPILPAETFIRLKDFLGGNTEVRTERLQTAALPQHFADRYGWPEMVAQIAQAYGTLTAQEKSEACILTQNYGEAGAVDFYGPAYRLPKAISGHNSYYIWGPDGCTGQVIITVGFRSSDLAPAFESVQAAGKVDCGYCMPYENGALIFIGRGLKYEIQQAWPTTKEFN
jgi:dolichyl-phosphate-mannose-protein mannosyltransferase